MPGAGQIRRAKEREREKQTQPGRHQMEEPSDGEHKLYLSGSDEREEREERGEHSKEEERRGEERRGERDSR